MSGIPVNRSNLPIQPPLNPPHLNSDAGVLPSDIFRTIISFLNPGDKQVVTQINKYWERVTIDTGREQELTKLQELVRVFKTDLSSEQENQLDSIIGRLRVINGFPNLSQLKNSLIRIIEELADVLEELPDERLEVLKALAKTKNLNNVEYFCFLLDLRREIQLINRKPSASSKSKALMEICNKLLACGNINRAIKVANTIPDDLRKSCVLREICDKLLELKQIDRAREIVNTIPHRDLQSISLGRICNKFLELQNINGAIAIVNEISNEGVKSNCFRDISYEFLELQNIDEAIATAYEISTEHVQLDALGKICDKLRELEKIDRPIAIANTMPNHDLELDSLKKHSKRRKLIEVD
jgi:hypothetical protein